MASLQNANDANVLTDALGTENEKSEWKTTISNCSLLPMVLTKAIVPYYS